MRYQVLRREAVCADPRCGKVLPAGSRARYYGQGKIFCPEPHDWHDAEAPPDSPGPNPGPLDGPAVAAELRAAAGLLEDLARRLEA